MATLLTGAAWKRRAGVFSSPNYSIMLTRYLLVMLIAGSVVTAGYGQKAPTSKVYEAWMAVTSEDRAGYYAEYRGRLRELRDSSVVLAYRKRNNYENYTLAVRDIERMAFRTTGRVGRGAIFGTLGGFAAGYLLGYAFSSDDEPRNANSGPPYYINLPEILLSRGDKALVVSLLTTPLGGVVGALIGTKKIKIPIGGSQSAYQRQREQLQQYIFR
jgi:hypothetical protein